MSYSKEENNLISTKSIHTDNIKEIYEIPMSIIIRPFPSTNLDENKIKNFMEILQNPSEKDLLPPIDIHWVHIPETNLNYYYSMGGCHRFEAHKRLGLPTIRAKFIKTTPSMINSYLGCASPFYSKE